MRPSLPLRFALAAVCLIAIACADPQTNTTPIAPTPRLAVATPLAPVSAATPAPVEGSETAALPSPQPTPTDAPQPTPPALRPLNLERAFPQLNFQRLTNLVQPANGDNRLFVTEQAGRVLAFANDHNPAEASVVLDIRERVNDSGNEEGLLGLAFDPEFADHNFLYLYYSASSPRRSVVSRMAIAPGGAADPDSELVLLEVEQPYSNHNGGELAFGPDGYLYIALGDGGSRGDPLGSGQNLGTLLGAILRIDVRDATAEEPYRIPADNPFVDTPGARGEIWAYGLRNPWRFSFDRATGELWTGDVGQNRFEEVDLVVRGGNYGWNTLEAAHCFNPPSGCDPGGAIPPVLEYPINGGCSVIGGYVYRRQGPSEPLPSLYGAYVFADYCSGRVWAVRLTDGRLAEQTQLADTGLRITSFGEDRDGNLYILSQDSGIYRFAP